MRWLSKYYTSWDSLKQRCMHISEHDVIGLDYTELGAIAHSLTEEDISRAITKIAVPKTSAHGSDTIEDLQAGGNTGWSLLWEWNP